VAINVQAPEGKPLNATLPVVTEQVGWVIVPIVGAVGGAVIVKVPVTVLTPAPSSMVIVTEPAGVEPVVVMVRVVVGFGVPLPADTVVGLKTPDAPVGNPETLKVPEEAVPEPVVFQVIVKVMLDVPVPAQAVPDCAPTVVEDQLLAAIKEADDPTNRRAITESLRKTERFTL
jgi:hypothetical protein